MRNVNLRNIVGGLCALLFFDLASASRLQGRIDGFKLFNCGEKYCLKMESPTAYISKFGGNYAFDKVSITLIDKKTNQTQIFSSLDTYYDVYLKKVFIRNTGKDSKENVIYDIREQKITSFKL